MRLDDSGPAFGHAAENGHCCGATLRDYFAAAALQGIMAAHKNPNFVNGIMEGRDEQAQKGNFVAVQDYIVGLAYELADAMLAHR